MADITQDMLELVELAGSQRKAAREAGINQATISRVCAGKTGMDDIKMDTVTKARAALTKLRRKSKVA